ncbi:MAG: substrate-binding domain-containing protein [Hyphomicrobiales bacterium]|nr:substrate-binding domain-containing protein [Hyphomicrobiales bacterium]
MSGVEIKMLHAGAITQVVQVVVPEFERRTGHRVALHRDTAGALSKLIEADEPFDLALLTPDAIDKLTAMGKFVAGSRTDIARVGVGLVVKEGTPLPEIGSVDAFRSALLRAKSVAYIDPHAGGSSGIYVAGLLEKLGIAVEVNAKAKLIHGGAVATHIADGAAELGIHQISEILPVAGVVLVGPLPDAIQNYTTYSAAVARNARQPDAARDLIRAFAAPENAGLIRAKGLDPINA